MTHGQTNINFENSIIVCNVLTTHNIPPFRRGLLSIFRFHADWIQPEQHDAGNFLPMYKATNSRRLLFASCYEHVSNSHARMPMLGVKTYIPGGKTNIQRQEYTSREKKTTTLKTTISYRSF